MTTNELSTVLNSVLENQKTGFGVNEVVAIISAVIALAALCAAILARRDSSKSAEEAKNSNDLNRNIARRQGLIELHMVWQNIAKIDPNNPIFPDVINAATALQTTATLWFSGVLDTKIIRNSYGQDFKELYESISQCQQVIPKDGRKCSELITSEIVRAYDDMNFK